MTSAKSAFTYGLNHTDALPACGYTYNGYVLDYWRFTADGQPVRSVYPAGSVPTSVADPWTTDNVVEKYLTSTEFSDAARNVTATAVWKPATYTVRFKGVGDASDGGYTIAGKAAASTTHTYTYPAAYPAPSAADVYRQGYAFTGWSDATVASGSTSSSPIFAGSSFPAGAWGDKVLSPSFTIKSYKVVYNTNGNGVLAGADDDGTQTFDFDDICATTTTDGATVTGAQLATVSGFKGYRFVGWSTENLSPGATPTSASGNHAPFTRVDRDDVRLHLWPLDDTTQKNQQQNTDGAAVPLYPVWESQTTAVSLTDDHPAEIRMASTAGGGSGASRDNVAVQYAASGETAATESDHAGQSLVFWPGQGKGLTYNTNAEHLTTGAALIKTKGNTVDTNVVKPLARKGYTFAGWGVKRSLAEAYGKAPASLPSSYDGVAEAYRTVAIDADNDVVKSHPKDESDACTDFDEAADEYVLYLAYTPASGDAGASLALTKSGENLVSAWEGRTNADNEAIDPDNFPIASDEFPMTTWEPVWEAEPYMVTLRIPTSVVDAGGYSTSHWSVVDDKYAGWVQADLLLHYWDKVWIPYFDENTDNYTFDGWYTKRTEGERVGAGDPPETAGGNKTYIAGEGGPSGFQYAGGMLRVNDTSGTRALDSSVTTAGADKQIWLNYTTVKIGVTAPMFAYLCEKVVDGDGNDVSPEPAYVVGSDTRTLLESKLKFETSAATSHDFVVTDVELTYGKDADGELWAADLLDSTSQAQNGRFFWLSRESTVNNYPTDGSNNSWVSENRDGSGGEASRLYFGTEADGAGRNNFLKQAETNEGGEATGENLAAGLVDLRGFVVTRPGSTREVDGVTFEDVFAEGAGEDAAPTSRVTTFWYGLNLNKSAFDVEKAKAAVASAYNDAVAASNGSATGISTTEQNVRLARLTFTFAPLS